MPSVSRQPQGYLWNWNQQRSCNCIGGSIPKLPSGALKGIRSEEIYPKTTKWGANGGNFIVDLFPNDQEILLIISYLPYLLNTQHLDISQVYVSKPLQSMQLQVFILLNKISFGLHNLQLVWYIELKTQQWYIPKLI